MANHATHPSEVVEPQPGVGYELRRRVLLAKKEELLAKHERYGHMLKDGGTDITTDEVYQKRLHQLRERIELLGGTPNIEVQTLPTGEELRRRGRRLKGNAKKQ